MESTTLQARIALPAFAVPGAMDALMALDKAIAKTSLPEKTRELVHIRASQINACGMCCVGHPRTAKKLGETDERIWAIAGWRDAPYFDDAERSALALAEAITRLADQADAVPDDVWDDAARHYGDQQLAALVLTIAQVNLWNRMNVATRQVAGQEW